MNAEDQAAMSKLWWDEIENCEIDGDCYDAADCADLPEALDLYRVQALSDPNFDASFGEWGGFIFDKRIWLPLEQCCNDGVLMPMDLRVTRIQTCPRELLNSLGYFFEHCPSHVVHHVAHYVSLLVKMDRGRRTGNPEWRPGPLPSRPRSARLCARPSHP